MILDTDCSGIINLQETFKVSICEIITFIDQEMSFPSLRFPWIHLSPSSMTADRAKSSVAILCHAVGGHILEGAPAFSPVSSSLCPCSFHGHSYVHPSTLTQRDVSINSTSGLITVLLCTGSDFPPICRCPNWTTTLNMAILFTLCQNLPLLHRSMSAPS